MKLRKPTKEELVAAQGTTVPDIIAPNLDVLFCGINPSVYSAVVGHHFARPGNRFWPTLHTSGFTPRLPAPTTGGAMGAGAILGEVMDFIPDINISKYCRFYKKPVKQRVTFLYLYAC